MIVRRVHDFSHVVVMDNSAGSAGPGRL